MSWLVKTGEAAKQINSLQMEELENLWKGNSNADNQQLSNLGVDEDPAQVLSR